MEIPLSYENYQILGIEHTWILAFIIPTIIFLTFYILKDGVNKKKVIFLITRLLIISLLIIAIASPYLVRLSKEYDNITSIIILADNSKSMEIFGNQNISSKLYYDLKNIIKSEIGFDDMVSFKYFSEGNGTDIGGALYQYIKKDNRNYLIILITDGNDNYGMNAIDVAKILGSENITVYSLIPDSSSMKSDVYISNIIGYRKVPVNADYVLRVEIGKNGNLPVNYDLILRVNNKFVKKVSIYQNESVKYITTTLNFHKSSLQRIEAIIKTSRGDFFENNNRFNKIVEVAERPRILLLSDDISSPLLSVLNKNYDVILTNKTDILKHHYNDNYRNYDAIFIDNMPYDRLIDVVDILHNYVIDGNGLVVVGGDKSYENGNYNNSYFETLLPVISAEKPEEKRQPIAVVFCMDVSASLGFSGERGYKSYLDEGKAIAINLLRQLNANDSVAVLAFNIPVWVWPRSGLIKISDNMALIEDYISKLKPTEGGTSFYPVLTKSEDILKDYDLEKYVIFISDGCPSSKEESRELLLNQIKRMADNGIRVYTISIGDRAQARTGMPLMQDMAKVGNGLYFWMEENDRLKAVFKKEGGRRERDFYHIGVYDRYHFITKDIQDFVTSIKKYNGVTPKSIAQTLLVTQDNDAILTVWRFGLGRVASLTTDNGREWALNIYTTENGKLISAITNWAIGNLEKNKRIQITTEDIHLGQESTIRIKSEGRPTLTASYKNKENRLTLKQIDLNRYYTSINPDREGFYTLRAEVNNNFDIDGIAVNYPVEYSSLGVNFDVLSRITELTNGRLYNMSQIGSLEEDAVEYVKKVSLHDVRNKTDISTYLLITALSIFFIDAVIRRINDILKIKKRRKDAGRGKDT